MRGTYLIFIALFITFAVCLANVRWSEWRALTKCGARPCGCEANIDHVCKHGYQMQVRICLRDEGDLGSCKFDAHGSIRKARCYNGNDTCPGWSSWTFPEECDCTNKSNGVKFAQRFCNNPPPFHDSVRCVTEDGTQATEEINEYMTQKCPCEDEVTTEMPFTESVTTEMLLPCCKKDTQQNSAYGDYGNNDTSSSIVYPDYGNVVLPKKTSNDSSSASKDQDYVDYQDYEYEGITCRYGNGCPEKMESNSTDPVSLEL